MTDTIRHSLITGTIFANDGQASPEARIIINLLVSQHNGLAVARSLDILVQDRVDHRVNVLIHVLEHEGVAKLDGQFQLLEEVRVVERRDFQVVLLLPFPDPVEGLLLGVDAERVACRLCGEDAVLDREFVRGEGLRCPLADLNIVGEERLQLEGLAEWNLLVQDILLPVFKEHLVTEVP